ncbi:hypothetical protein K402DRAFT_136367 [Aulographum hederae CBS 113979]|uniref:Uncharacterized protein n=1 Tax=Aulographum hederae CBS 113979 TaxID=1176131 RepID=A0A6G1GV09_9PEZI|nr:hypothetical protein K402DRAFT_136367 [Aulographum hederae CBS 113979]
MPNIVVFGSNYAVKNLLSLPEPLVWHHRTVVLLEQNTTPNSHTNMLMVCEPAEVDFDAGTDVWQKAGHHPGFLLHPQAFNRHSTRHRQQCQHAVFSARRRCKRGGYFQHSTTKRSCLGCDRCLLPLNRRVCRRCYVSLSRIHLMIPPRSRQYTGIQSASRSNL